MKINPGTIFKFTNSEARGHSFHEGEWDQLCVAIFDNELSRCKGRYRRLSCRNYHTGAVDELPLKSIEIVGYMTPEFLGTTKWSEKFKKLPLGTRFKFNEMPDRWSHHSRVSTDTEFEVIEHDDFIGVGQCIVARSIQLSTDVAGSIYSFDNGVFRSDNIQIIDNTDEKWKPVSLALGTQFRFKSFPNRWNYYEGNSTTLFEVIDKGDKFTGVGQAIKMIGHSCPWYSSADGVIPSDDIVIAQVEEEQATQDMQGFLELDNSELKGTGANWHATAKRLEKENGELTCAIYDWQEDAMSHREQNDRLTKRIKMQGTSMASMTTSIYKLRGISSSKKPGKFVTFFKKIW